jgi:hypothetical protein
VHAVQDSAEGDGPEHSEGTPNGRSQSYGARHSSLYANHEEPLHRGFFRVFLLVGGGAGTAKLGRGGALSGGVGTERRRVCPADSKFLLERREMLPAGSERMRSRLKAAGQRWSVGAC